jgi:hypothetical protein
VIFAAAYSSAAAPINFNRIHSTFRFNGLIAKIDQGGNRIVQYRGSAAMFGVRGEKKGLAARG